MSFMLQAMNAERLMLAFDFLCKRAMQEIKLAGCSHQNSVAVDISGEDTGEVAHLVAKMLEHWNFYEVEVSHARKLMYISWPMEEN
ncbi:hypothetical protein KAMAJI_01540 [Serratia phage vB_SmaM-Kamaji]|nr:hypothetical protein KAMAJI_01540 [Serratia phage vB_SmaM-Kamaji]